MLLTRSQQHQYFEEACMQRINNPHSAIVAHGFKSDQPEVGFFGIKKKNADNQIQDFFFKSPLEGTNQKI